MHIKNGLIPTVLGTVVTATGVALKKSNIPDSYRNGIIGFGLANIALGSAEMVTDKSMAKNTLKGIMDKGNIKKAAEKAIFK